MSWQEDKGIIIFMLLMVVFILFCAFMAVRSAKKQKRNGTEEGVQQVNKQPKKESAAGLGFAIFIGVIWLASAVLVLILDQAGSLGPSFSIPRIMALPYELLGVVGGAVVQIILSLAVIISSIRSLIKRKSSKE